MAGVFLVRPVGAAMLAAAAALSLISSPTYAAKSSGGAGFTCTSSEGLVRRFNVDLKKERYDDGEGVKPLYRVSDTKIELEGPNPFIVAGPNPFFHTLALDRISLMLTDEVVEPQRGLRRETRYQCVMGPIVDFSVGRKF